METRPPFKIGFVYVSLQDDGPYATVQVPTHKWEDPSLDVPIKPSRDYGSAVLVDYDGTVPGAIEALRKACSAPNVTVRFVAKRGQAAPVVPNYGSNAVTKWRGGLESFHIIRGAYRAPYTPANEGYIIADSTVYRFDGEPGGGIAWHEIGAHPSLLDAEMFLASMGALKS
jgi:hypothetical protein